MDLDKLEMDLQEYFDSMTRDEIKGLFTDLGFEVEDSDGKGKIVYTDSQKEFHYNLDGETYSINQKNKFKAKDNKNLDIDFKFLVA